MKFTDMNFDCLETVLEYLELIDLLNVADSTKRLNKAAELVFARKPGKKDMRIWVTRISRDRLFTIKDKIIEIKDLKTALQLLRCFGPAIPKIWVNGRDAEIDPKVFTYINKYCGDYLKKLEISETSERNDLLNYFDRPFPKVTTFESTDLVSTKNVCLNKLFPKMRCLYIRHCFYSDSSFYNFNKKHFPYLEELSISHYNISREFLRNEMVINLLQLNPQLKMLDVHSWDQHFMLSVDLIRSAVDSLQNIERLKLCLQPITFLNNSDNIIRMKNVKSFQIDFDWQYIDFSSCLLPFLFKNLKIFCIYFPKAQFVNGSFIDQFFNFIDKHPSITILLICNIERFDVLDWSRLAKSLPLLPEFYISGCYISSDEAMEIMAKFKMLNKFAFRLKGDYDNFRKHLAKNWDAIYVMDERIVKLKRKI